jgi:hypothetical protein
MMELTWRRRNERSMPHGVLKLSHYLPLVEAAVNRILASYASWEDG